MPNNDNSNYYSPSPEGQGNGEYSGTSKLLLSKYDFDLFDETKAVPTKIIRVKRIGNTDKTEKWRILENDELMFVVDGDKLNKKERSFLRSLDGVNFLIQEFKCGIASLKSLKAKMKTLL